MDKVAFTNYVRVNRSEDALSYGITDLGLGFEPGFQITDYVTGDSGNEGMVSDPTYDALYAKAVAETSLDGYKADLTAMNKEVAEQHFSISCSQLLPMHFVSRGSRVTTVRRLRLTLHRMPRCGVASICPGSG